MIPIVVFMIQMNKDVLTDARGLKIQSRRDAYTQCGMRGKIIYRRRDQFVKQDIEFNVTQPSKADFCMMQDRMDDNNKNAAG